MKKVVSVSLGSARRDHEVTVELLGQTFVIARRGTDGDFDRACQMLRELDGQVDAIGLGGIDVYLRAGEDCYTVQDGLRLMQQVRQTPVVDGSGLKNTLERQVVYYLREKTSLLPPGSRVLMVSAVDRFGMAEAFSQLSCDVTYGDLIFTAGIPYPIKTMDELREIARKTLPEMCKLPFHMLYPTGKKQEVQDEVKISKFGHYYHQAQVIAGDFHLVRRYMPHDLQGPTVITNTTTREDVEFFRRCGVGTLVTTTPEFQGRSFGTNVLEAVLVVLLNKPVEQIVEQDYLDLLKRLDFQPRLLELN